MFESYGSESSFDEVFDEDKNIRKAWNDILQNINDADTSLLQEKQEDINWHIENNGVTYNTYDSNDKNTKRYWSMDPIPFVISKEEWQTISEGLKQRAKLLNLVFKDLYSEQKLLKENILPAEVVFGHKGFASEAFNFGFKENFNLYFYATDIARGPDGKFWVISDRTQAPSGLGYALENRLTMNTVAKEIYPNVNTQKLYPFIDQYKALLKKLSGGDLSKAALLTPGPHNETYFEHAYLSSFLEINLVQGADLLSKDGAIWLKSLGGLKEINTLVRRVDDRYCDPLELRDDSHLGVAGLTDAMRQDNLNMINPIGSAILENAGLNPFMEKIAEYFLGEKLILPQIATWWCGQRKEQDYVLENLQNLIIKKIDRTENIEVYLGPKLTEQDIDSLKERIQRSPHQYVAQEEISFSTVPFYKNEKIEPRNAVVRTYCVRDADSYSVMNGGLVLVSSTKDTLLVSSQKGGSSKDLWILGGENEVIPKIKRLTPSSQYIETSINEIPTLKAENLFWLGRYLSRTIFTTRFISHIIERITNFYRYEIPTSKESQLILEKALTHLTMTYPGFLDEDNIEALSKVPMNEIASVIKDGSRVGSLAFTVSMLANINLNLKDLLTLESSKLFEKTNQEWNEFTLRKKESTMGIAKKLDKFLIHMMAYKELVRESIFKEQGITLYEVGYTIESALLLISNSRSMLSLKLDKFVGYDILESMLSSQESFNAYRSYYKSSLTLENVISFLILNPKFPKSLISMADRLLEHFQELPKTKDYVTSYEKPMVQAQTILSSLSVEALLHTKEEDGVYNQLDVHLENLAELFTSCSNEFSNTYFAHYDE